MKEFKNVCEDNERIDKKVLQNKKKENERILNEFIRTTEKKTAVVLKYLGID
jgi:hypothetical protein